MFTFTIGNQKKKKKSICLNKIENLIHTINERYQQKKNIY